MTIDLPILRDELAAAFKLAADWAGTDHTAGLAAVATLIVEKHEGQAGLGRNLLGLRFPSAETVALLRAAYSGGARE